MNNNPCSLCTHLYNRAFQAFVKREHREYDRLMGELDTHRETCGNQWYRLLWPNAVVTVVNNAA